MTAADHHRPAGPQPHQPASAGEPGGAVRVQPVGPRVLPRWVGLGGPGCSVLVMWCCRRLRTANTAAACMHMRLPCMLRPLPCCAVEDVVALLRLGQSNRRTGETNMNERSSRSHRWAGDDELVLTRGAACYGRRACTAGQLLSDGCRHAAVLATHQSVRAVRSAAASSPASSRARRWTSTAPRTSAPAGCTWWTWQVGRGLLKAVGMLWWQASTVALAVGLLLYSLNAYQLHVATS